MCIVSEQKRAGGESKGREVGVLKLLTTSIPTPLTTRSSASGTVCTDVGVSKSGGGGEGFVAVTAGSGTGVSTASCFFRGRMGGGSTKCSVYIRQDKKYARRR